MCLIHKFYMQYKYISPSVTFYITSQKKLLYKGRCMYAYVYLCVLYNFVFQKFLPQKCTDFFFSQTYVP